MNAFLRCPTLFLPATAYVFFVTSSVLAEDWPQWRGPRYDGTSIEKDLPTTWSNDSGIAWQCPLPPWGNSTPVVCGDAVFLTTQAEGRDLLLLKINKPTGKILWTRTVSADHVPEQGDPNVRKLRRNTWYADSQGSEINYAGPSPVTNGKVVVAHFGNGDLAAYDFDGKQLWHRNLQRDYGEYSIWWGHANSPVIYENMVISLCIQDCCSDLPGEPSVNYVVAHDLLTGKECWKTDRPPVTKSEPGDSYTTPIFWKNGDRLEMVVWGGLILDAYNPKDGSRLWNLSKDLTGNRTITGPVAAHGMIYATQGMRQPILAVRPGGDGDRPTEDIVWQSNKDTPDSPTPVVWDKWLFAVNNNGGVRCFDALTGQQQWKEKLPGDYRASLLAADGKIYIQNCTGLTTVVKAGPEFERLAENQIDDQTLASPIVSEGHLYLRGHKALYCIGK